MILKKWMEGTQAALVSLPRFQLDFASRLTESSKEVRVAVFFWVCRTIQVRKRFDVGQPFLHILLILPFLPSSRLCRLCCWSTSKYGVSLKDFNCLVKMMKDECVDVKESIHAEIREIAASASDAACASGAASAASAASDSGAASASKTKTPMSTSSHSRSASPTKSTMRDMRLTPSLPSSAAKRKAAVSEVVSASEDDEGAFTLDTPSRKRPRRAAAASAARVMPMSKAATASSSEGEETTEEDVEMSVKGATRRCKEPEKGKTTSARKGKSIHATAPKMLKTSVEKFAAIAEKEQETVQKVLDLKRLKVKGENDKVLARIQAKADLKMQRMKLKAELAQKKLDHDFQLQMARIGRF